MQSNQLVNFANEFDFMPDLALFQRCCGLMRARSVRGCQGEGLPKSDGLPLQNWALISSWDLIKLVNVTAETVRVVGSPADPGAAAGLGPRDPRGDGSPLSQVGVTLVLNFKPALCRGGDWRERVGGSKRGNATGAWGKPGGAPNGPRKGLHPRQGPRFGSVAFKSSRKFAWIMRPMWTGSGLSSL